MAAIIGIGRPQTTRIPRPPRVMPPPRQPRPRGGRRIGILDAMRKARTGAELEGIYHSRIDTLRVVASRRTVKKAERLFKRLAQSLP